MSIDQATPERSEAGEWFDAEGRWHEPIFRHAGITGWHHHHWDDSTGVVIHDTEGTNEFVDSEDGAVLVASTHGADHDMFGLNLDDPCRDSSCIWACVADRFGGGRADG